MKQVNRLFFEVFGEAAYHGPDPGDAHLERLLADGKFIALAGWIDGEMAGALAAYELVKYEAERSEIYIYDLAQESNRRAMDRHGNRISRRSLCSRAGRKETVHAFRPALADRHSDPAYPAARLLHRAPMRHRAQGSACAASGNLGAEMPNGGRPAP